MDTSQFVKRMPPGARVLRKLAGTVVKIGEKDVEFSLRPKKGEEVKGSLPIELLKDHGIAKEGQAFEYWFVRAVPGKSKILLRPIKERRERKDL